MLGLEIFTVWHQLFPRQRKTYLLCEPEDDELASPPHPHHGTQSKPAQNGQVANSTLTLLLFTLLPGCEPVTRGQVLRTMLAILSQASVL